MHDRRSFRVQGTCYLTTKVGIREFDCPQVLIRLVLLRKTANQKGAHGRTSRFLKNGRAAQASVEALDKGSHQNNLDPRALG